MAPYEFKWKLAEKFLTTKPLRLIKLDTEFTSSLEGDGNEIVSITFLDLELFKDEEGNNLLASPMRDSLNGIAYVDEDVKEMISLWADIVAYTCLGFIVLNLLLSVLFKTSLDTMWIMVNFL